MEALGSNGCLIMKADETLRMERLAHRIGTIIHDGFAAFGAFGSEVLLVANFAEELTAFFNEANVLKRAFTSGARANKRVRRERLAQRQDEGTSDLSSADGADREFS